MTVNATVTSKRKSGSLFLTLVRFRELSIIIFILLLIAIVAIARWGQKIATHPVQITSPILNLIVYFGLAFIFLSLTHFSVLRARWLWQQIPITPQVARMWFWYGAIFFLLLIIISVANSMPGERRSSFE